MSNEVVEKETVETDPKTTSEAPSRLQMAEMRAQMLEERVRFLETIMVNGNFGGQTTLKQKGGRGRTPKRVLDIKTGITYDALNKCGAAVAPEFGLEVNNWSWYAVKALAPDRFQILD